MMAREEYIRIYRSSVPGATPSLTSGEIAANLVDGKLFVGATNADGSLRNVVFNDVRASVASIGVGHGLSASGSTGTITLYNMGVTSFNGLTGTVNYYPPIANSSGTGVAYFRPGDFNVSLTGAVTLDSAVVKGSTGNTVVSGIAAGVSSIAGNTIAINNLGVTSFNGLTGTINYYPPFATNSVTGVASFDSKDFGVVSGVVSSRGVTGISAGNTGIAIDGPTGEVVISNMGVLSFNGSTGHVSVSIGQTVTGDGGALIGANNSLITSRVASYSVTGVASFNSKQFTVDANGRVGLSGEYDTPFTLNNVKSPASLTFGTILNNTHPDPLNFQVDGQQIKLQLRAAGALGVAGIASFNSSQFLVDSFGTVELKNAVQGVAVGASSFTGTVSITNGSNVTISTANNRITISSSVGATGNTLVSGIAAGVSAVAGNTIAINNLGVTSFNGATGAINYYPPFATNSVTGVAAFDSKDFGVVSGVVSSRGVTGISAGNTGIAIDGATGEVVVTNMGVLSFNGSTGHVSVSIGQTVTGDGGALIGANNSLITIRLADTTATGAASFSSTNFDVSEIGAVSIKNLGVPNAALVNSGFTLRDDSQQTSTVSLGDTLAITGGTGVVFRKTAEDNYVIYSNFTINNAPPNGNNFTVETDGKLSIPFATSSVTGVASFPSSYFSVAADGAVEILNPKITFIDATGSFVDVKTLGYGAGWTSLTLTAGSGIHVRLSPTLNPPGNALPVYTIFNTGVTSFNGSTGAINYYPPIATNSVTGVASFPPTFFSVADGAVSLSGGIGFRDSFNTTDVVNYNETFTLTGFGSNGIRVESAGNNTFRFTNLGVTSFNGQAGAINYYPPIANASGGTGLAYFRPGDFNVSGTGAVTLDSSVVKGATGHTVLGNGAITINAGAGNIRTVTVGLAGTSATGVAAFRDSNFDVSLTGAVSIKASGVPNAALANSSVTVSAGTGLGGGGSVSLGNTVTLTNRGVTSFNGLTGAVTLTGDGGAILGVNNNSITARIVDCNGASGVVAFDCSVFTIDNGVVTGVKTITPGTACADCAGTAANSSECNACEGLGCNCTFLADMSGGKCICDPMAFDGNGLESEYDANGNLVALWVSADNLNNYTGDFTTKTTPKVVMFDPDEAGLQKTKAVTIQDLFVKNYNVFESKTPNQLASPNKKGSNDKIEFEIVTGLLAQGDQGLLKGGTAYEYIANNTISSINGCTGGTFSITGTEQEVTVTTGINCRQIVIGLPDSVRIPHISGTGGTFSGTITANKFVGSMDGGLF